MRIVESIRKLFAPSSLSTVPQSGGGGWRPIVHEPFTGAWQRGQELKHGTLTAYSTVYACLSRITKDIGKLPFQLKEMDGNGLWRETTNPAYSALLRRPNHYQTPAQFREAWILSKLQHGNTYVLKKRDHRNVVDALYVLDPNRVQPMIAESGDVYYRISFGTNDVTPGHSGEQITVPSMEVIHDMELALFHPLVGVPPLAAAHLAACKNVRIQENEASFFANGANPAGILTAPAGMTEEDGNKIREAWQRQYTGPNSGNVALLGADLKYQAFSAANRDSQLVEQLKYSDEQICHAFGIPPYKVGIGSIPAGMKVDDLNQMYYSDALQARIEAMEDCLDRALNLGDRIGVELSLEPLLRMDAQKQAEVEGALVSNGIKAPNEARRRFGLPPLQGGDSVYLQQQNYSLEALARRDASDDPFGSGQVAERQLSPGLRMLKGLTEQARRRRLRFNHVTGDWDDAGPLAA